MDHDQAQCARYHIEVLAAQMRRAGADERMLASLRNDYVAEALRPGYLLKDVIRYSVGRGSDVRFRLGEHTVVVDAGDLIESVRLASVMLMSTEHDMERQSLALQVQNLRSEVERLKGEG